MLMPGPGGPYHITFQASPLRQIMEQVRPKHIQLPPMRKVTETLGALGTLARQFLIRSAAPEKDTPDSLAGLHSAYTSSNNGDDSYHDLFSSATSNINASYAAPTTSNAQLFGAHPLKVTPENDEQLLSALYTLGRNVLGQVRFYRIH